MPVKTVGGGKMSCPRTIEIQQRMLEKKTREVEENCQKIAKDIYAFLDKHPPKTSMRIEFTKPKKRAVRGKDSP